MHLALLLVLLLLMSGCGRLLAAAPRPLAAPPPAVAGGGMRLWQDGAVFDEARSLLAAPGRRLWVEMYEFGREDLAELLLAARAAGADVRVVTDPSVRESVRTAERLRAAGLPVRFYPLDDRAHQIDHVKLLLTSSAALVGGMNWGATSARNHDYELESRAPPLLARLAAIFGQDWSLAGGTPAPLAPAIGTAAQTAPGEEIRNLLERDLSAARSRVEAEVFVLTDPEILRALAAAVRRGVKVRVMLDPNQAVNLSGYRVLRAAGVPVRWYPVAPPAKLHAKTGLFDGRLVVGSANWSRSGLSSNHELDLETVEPAPVAAYARRFEADWALGRP